MYSTGLHAAQTTVALYCSPPAVMKYNDFFSFFSSRWMKVSLVFISRYPAQNGDVHYYYATDTLVLFTFHFLARLCGDISLSVAAWHEYFIYSRRRRSRGRYLEGKNRYRVFSDLGQHKNLFCFSIFSHVWCFFHPVFSFLKWEYAQNVWIRHGNNNADLHDFSGMDFRYG